MPRTRFYIAAKIFSTAKSYFISPRKIFYTAEKYHCESNFPKKFGLYRFLRRNKIEMAICLWRAWEITTCKASILLRRNEFCRHHAQKPRKCTRPRKFFFWALVRSSARAQKTKNKILIHFWSCLSGLLLQGYCAEWCRCMDPFMPSFDSPRNTTRLQLNVRRQYSEFAATA